jgi:hypothetical protein
MNKCHVFCWSIPLLATILPLYQCTIGPLESPNHQWCTLLARERTSNFDLIMWNFLGFWIWLLFAIFLIIYWMIRFFYKAYFSRSHYGIYLSIYLSLYLISINPSIYQSINSDELIREVVKKIRLYPISMSICWIIAFFSMGPWYSTTSGTTHRLVGLSMTLGMCLCIYVSICLCIYESMCLCIYVSI